MFKRGVFVEDRYMMIESVYKTCVLVEDSYIIFEKCLAGVCSS